VIEKIPHLVALGVTDVELLPVTAFDGAGRAGRGARDGARQLLGLQPPLVLCPHGRYSASADARAEFRDMVKALHKAGNRVILESC